MLNKSKIFILAATIFSFSVGLVTPSLSDGHGGMAVPKIEVTTVLSGLENNPWDMAFTNDGKAMFFTEKYAGLSVLVVGKVHQLYCIKDYSSLCIYINKTLIFRCLFYKSIDLIFAYI